MRTETFVFRFETQEVFGEFFEKFFKNPPKGIVPLACSTGNSIKQLDEVSDKAYKFGEKFDPSMKERDDFLDFLTNI